MNSPILFSVVVPTYNRAYLISKTIDSILAQTYTNYEVFIVDDGSTDNTEEVVRPYLSDKVFYFRKENAERGAARNFGTLKAKGDYINWFDSDDVMLPHHLQHAADNIQKWNAPEIFMHGYQYQDIDGNVLFYSNFPADMNQSLYMGNQIALDDVFVRRDIALADLFSEDRDISASEDFELWLRLGAKYKIHVSDEVTIGFLYHEQRSIIAMKDRDQLINRYTKFIAITTSNPDIVRLLGKNIGVFVMKNYLLLAVDLTNNKHLDAGLKYFKLALGSSPKIIFEKGFYAFLKHYIRHTLF